MAGNFPLLHTARISDYLERQVDFGDPEQEEGKMTRKGVYQLCCVSGGVILALFNHMDSATTWFAAYVVIGICAPEDK